MALTPPDQIRTTDPYHEDRYSTFINRFTRIFSRGNDVILEPHDSFQVELTDTTTITVSPGLFIKDDALVHINEEYVVEADNNDYYEDPTGDMDSDGYYILVVKYNYTRSVPAPKAYFKIIRDESIYTGDLDSYMFLGSFYVSGGLIDLTIPFYDRHPDHQGDSDFERSYIDHAIDGGELT